MGQAYFNIGEGKKAADVGKAMMEYGQSRGYIRSLVMGHYVSGISYYLDGDFPSAIECSKRAIEVSADPFYTETPRLILGISYLANGQLQEADDSLQEVLAYSRDFGAECLGTPAYMALGMIAILSGQPSKGFQMVEDAQRALLESGRKPSYALAHYMLGKAYVFLQGTVPFASQKATEHLNKSIETAREIGAKGTLGMAHLDLGLLHASKDEKDQARKCISTAIELFEQCELENSLRQAKEALESL
jgi:tetratricopeptide (TPR) repeat protein